MATAKQDQDQELDFTQIFAPKAAGSIKPADPVQVESDALIGAADLKKGGYCVSLTRRRTQAHPAAPPNARILVVEDDLSVAALLERLLTRAGYQPAVAGSGRELVERLRTPPLPHLVLLDVMLPDIEGFKILERIRQHQVIGDLPVVLLTAKSDLADLMRGIAAGADGYITKPAKREAVEAVIKQVLSGAPG